MTDKNNSIAAIPGVGLLVVAFAVIFGVAPARKDGEKKADPMPNKSALATMTEEKKEPSGHLKFLTEKRILQELSTLGLRLPLYIPHPQARFLILTLPDPIDTQLGYLYDHSLDALTQAMSQLRQGKDKKEDVFTLADRWFPWTIAWEDKSKNILIRTGDPSREPGILVYNNTADVTDRIVVLVVGENPISGLRIDALKTALHLAALAPAGNDRSIHLVGPFFTGSQSSLAWSVFSWSAERNGQTLPRLKCISGTALGLKPWDKILPPDRAKKVRKYCDEIAGTQVPYSELRRAALHYLSKPGRTSAGEPLVGRPVGRVAYLVEANSGFGTMAANEAIPKAKTPGGPDAAGARSGSGRSPPPPLVFRFPMHIGRLAGIRSKEARERDERLGLIRPGDGRLTAVDETQTGGDLLPAADEIRTALINQRLLADFWSALQRERVRYVLIATTNKRDALFLIEQLRDACPDTQPVLFGSDLHYVYPDYLRFMRGVVVVGTYPLFLPAQRWQAKHGPKVAEIPFPSSIPQGVYNAVLASIGDATRMKNYHPPRLHPEEELRPPIWVTAVGENGEFVPLAYFTQYDDAGYLVPVAPMDPSVQSDQSMDRPEPPFRRPFFYLVLGACLATLVGVWWVWQVHRQTPLRARIVARATMLAGLRAQYVVIAGIGGVYAVLPLALALGSAHLRSGLNSESILFGMTIAILLILAVGTLAYLIDQARFVRAGLRRLSDGQSPQEVLAPWHAVGAALLIGGIGFAWGLVDHARLDDAGHTLFAERAANLYTGCSPVVPSTMIALGILGYGLLGLRQVRLMTRFQVAPPYPDWRNGSNESPPTEVGQRQVMVAAMGRIHDAAADIDARSRSLTATFFDPGIQVRARWVRLLVRVAVWLLAIFVIVWMAFLIKPRFDAFLWWAGAAVAVVSFAASFTLLLFVQRKEGETKLGRPRPGAWLLLVVTGCICVFALWRAQRTWESQGWNCLFAAGFLTLTFLILVSGYRLYLLWKQVEKITRSIAAIPMVGAFDSFPDKLSRVFGAYLLSSRRRYLDLVIPAHLLRLLKAALTRPDFPVDEQTNAQAALAVLPDDIDLLIAGRRGEELEGEQANALAAVAARLVGVLAPRWGERPAPEAFGTVAAEPGREPEPAQDWRTIAEQYIAVMAIIFISQFFTRMRYLAYMVVAPTVSLLLAITAYQFVPERFLMYTAVAFASTVICLLVWILYRINRNELVSRVTRSTPNRFSFDFSFAQNLIVFVLPLLAVVVTQLAGRMRSVVEPVLGWFR